MRTKFIFAATVMVFFVLVPVLGHASYGEPQTKTQAETTGARLTPATENTTELPAGLSAAWWTTVQENIRRSEYQVTWQDETCFPDIKAAYQAPNRAHNLRTYFTPQGIRVAPRTSTNPERAWGLSLQGYGFKGDVHPVDSPILSVSGNQVEYYRPGLTEWYVNDERGLAQGFVLESLPRSQGRDSESWVVLRMGLYGDLKAGLNSAGTEVEFGTAGGVDVARYGQVNAFDVDGRQLPVKLALAESGMDIMVDVACAGCPIIIYPAPVRSCWTAQGNQARGHFGISVGSAGDVNCDDFDDIIVGASAYDNGQENEGRAFVYYGSLSGLSDTADWTAESNVVGAGFGRSVAAVGDVNGDGYDDVIVGAPQFTNDQISEGAAFVYYGCSSSSGGLSNIANWTAEGNYAEGNFGSSVASAGKVNDDDYDDVIVGAPSYGQEDRGAAFVYYGSSWGLSQVADWTAHGDQKYAHFGHSVAAGDVNNDDYDDVIVGAPGYGRGREGTAFVFYGSPLGLPDADSDGRAWPNDADWTAESDQVNAYFGGSVAAGDVNCDGFDDIIVGAPLYEKGGQTDEGRAFVFHGSATGLPYSVVDGPTRRAHPSDADWKAERDNYYANFGSSVAAGDVNNDGCYDVVVGAPGYENGQHREGGVFVYYGSFLGLRQSPGWRAEGNSKRAAFGTSVAKAGDVNGDGVDDIIVGAPNSGGLAGAAFVYCGLGWSSGAVIDMLEPRALRPGRELTIYGRGFGNTPRTSVVHVNKQTFDSNSTRLLYWSNYAIKIRVPFRNKNCAWWGSKKHRNRRVWVTVDGVDSEVRRFKLRKPFSCP